MPLRTTRTAVAGLLLAVASVLITQPASAAPAPRDITVTAITATQRAGSAACSYTEATSDTPLYGIQWGGRRLCYYSWGGHNFGQGTLQVYVVGTNRFVYTKWRNPDGSFSA